MSKGEYKQVTIKKCFKHKKQGLLVKNMKKKATDVLQVQLLKLD